MAGTGSIKKFRRVVPLISVLLVVYQFKTFQKWLRETPEYYLRKTSKIVKHPSAPFTPASIPASSIRSMASEHSNEEATIVVTHSPHATTGTSEPCKCDLISIDCLASVRCLPQDLPTSQYFTALGVLTRKFIKRNINEFYDERDSYTQAPMGKTAQYMIISSWTSWILENKLPRQSSRKGDGSIFVDEKRYPFCAKNNLKGTRCFFGDLNADEDLDALEQSALTMSLPVIPESTKRDIENDTSQFLTTARLYQNSHQKHQMPTALSYILSFAHIARIRFNRQPPLLSTYSSHIHRTPAATPTTTTQNTLRVSLHIRRADACEHATTNYQLHASPIDSPAQVSGKRLCYATIVYINALKRIQELAHGNPRLDVYLATDHAGSVMDDIRDNFSELYHKWDWNVLEYERDVFRYEGMIEDPVNGEKQGAQGETAVADLWHLSHGQVFVGHLGSRFGKVSWLLAMARQNAFVPFFTVDGHSFCCEIDEACGDMKPYISDIPNCMTFHHDAHSKSDEDKKLYWEIGSQTRKRVAEKAAGKKLS